MTPILVSKNTDAVIGCFTDCYSCAYCLCVPVLIGFNDGRSHFDVEKNGGQ